MANAIRRLKKTTKIRILGKGKQSDLNYDISSILRNWDYDPTSINARWVMGHDGRMKVQLRLDLGLFQMESEGRPDGTRPRGYVSLLHYYRSIVRTATGGQALKLNGDACAELQQESLQYYYRYLSFYALRNFAGVVSDTDHNLAIIDLVTEFAEDEDHAWQFVQFFPYVRMMNARARAEQALAEKNHEEAIRALQKALDDINRFWSDYGESDNMSGNEVELLSDLLRQVMKQKPKTKADRLQEQLDLAIAKEDYEKAAVLRDQMKKLGHAPPLSSDSH